MRGILFAVVLLLLLAIACGSEEQLPTVVPTAEPLVEAPATNTPQPSDTPNPSDTPQIMCTAPACSENEVYFCPADCPGGCGTICVTVTPSIPSAQAAQVVYQVLLLRLDL